MEYTRQRRKGVSGHSTGISESLICMISILSTNVLVMEDNNYSYFNHSCDDKYSFMYS